MGGFNDWLIQRTDVEGFVTILDNVIDARIQRVTGAKANSLEVVVNNYRGAALVDGELKYKKGDLLKVFAKKDGRLNTSNLLNSELMGSFLVIDVEYGPDNNVVKLVCNDKTYELLSKVYVVKDTPEQAINLRIENIVQTIASGGTGTEQNTVTTDIASTRSDGSAFPSVTFTSVFKTAYEALNELSQTEMTGDNLPYIFWFDADDTFHWEYPGQTPEGTVFWNGYAPVKKIKTQTKDSEVISMVIYNAGDDLNDNAIFGYYIDPLASSIEGKTKYVPMLDIAKIMKTNVYYSDGMGGYTISNAEFRERAEILAKATAQNYTAIGKRGIFTASLTVEGDYYLPGKLYQVYAPETGFLQTALRITRIAHTFNKNGWDTILDLEQDPEALANL